MNVTDSGDAFDLSRLRDELERHGVLAAGTRVEFDRYAANFSRPLSQRRWHYRVRNRDKVLFHLIVGRQLRTVHERGAAFAQACPALICRPLFFHTADGLDLLGLEHFEGTSLDALVQTGACDRKRWLETVRHAQQLLESTARPSSHDRRAAELQHLIDLVAGDAAWSAMDRRLIRDLVQPAIQKGLEEEPAVLRWSNGDFAGRNLLVNTRGEIRLIDYESASLTHFGFDDWSRLFHFSVLPPEVASTPELERAHAPWKQAYCWLHQLTQLPKVASSPELDQHLPEVASRLLDAAVGCGADQPRAHTFSRLLELAAIHHRATEHVLTTRTVQLQAASDQRHTVAPAGSTVVLQHAPPDLLAAHAQHIENLSRQLHRERQTAAQQIASCGAAIRQLEAALANKQKPRTFSSELVHDSGWLRRDLDAAHDQSGRPRSRVRNFLIRFRHRLNLLADWLLGPCLPRPYWHRLRRAHWWLDPSSSGLFLRADVEVKISGAIRDSSGQRISEVFARVGTRRVIGQIVDLSADGYSHFIVRFRTKPGFKFLHLYARLTDGTIITLGYRLVFCRAPEAAAAVHADIAPPSASLHLSPAVLSALPEFCEQPTPRVSIVVPVYNQIDYTLRCLAAIAQHTSDIAYEVIVIDDCSPDRRMAQLRDIANLHLYRNAQNRGFLSSCNEGAAHARGEYIVLLNNDTEVQPGWLHAILEVFADRPDAGIVGAKLVYPDGSLQEAGGICWQDGSAWNYGRHGNALLPEFNYLRETDYCSGACIAMPRTLWNQLGGFDESYAPAYYEDTDLAFRMRAIGWKVYYQPQAVVVHHEGKSNGTDTFTGIKAYQVRNQTIFWQRWQHTLAAHPPNGQRVFRARERSFGRTIILMIDHYVPCPDQDAGSRNIMAYLQFFIQAGFVVKFIGHRRVPQPGYADRLKQLGVEAFDGEMFPNQIHDWLTRNGKEIDYIFLSRAYTSLHWLPLLRQHTSAKLLYYGHDLLSRTLRRAYDTLGDPRFLTESCVYDEIEREIGSQVDWIFYPSGDEVSFLKQQSPGAQIARLPLLTFAEPDRQAPRFVERSGLLFVGGFGHHPNVDAVQWFVSSVWPELLRRLPRLHLTIVGSNPTDAIRDLARGPIHLMSNVSDAVLHDLYRSHRIAIVPLRYGGGIKGKILEAMFMGTPVVATPIGAEGLAWPGEHMAIAAEADFSHSVHELYTISERWAKIQDGAWQFLAAEYSWRNLRDALRPAIPELLS